MDIKYSSFGTEVLNPIVVHPSIRKENRGGLKVKIHTLSAYFSGTYLSSLSYGRFTRRLLLTAYQLPHRPRHTECVSCLYFFLPKWVSCIPFLNLLYKTYLNTKYSKLKRHLESLHTTCTFFFPKSPDLTKLQHDNVITNPRYPSPENPPAYIF